MVEVTIQPNEFDSGHFGVKVGIVPLAQRPVDLLAAGRAIARAAAAQGVELVCIRSQVGLCIPGFQHVGTLCELQADPQDAIARSAPAMNRYEIRPLADDEWAAVAELMEQTTPTRFSNDSRLDRKLVAEHKLALLKAHRNARPELSLVVDGADGLAGLQVSRINDGRLDFYEVCIAPAYRRRMLAASLLAANLRNMLRLHPRATALSTRVYRHNTGSQQFFARLGFAPTGHIEHWYHGWFDAAAAHSEQTAA